MAKHLGDDVYLRHLSVIALVLLVAPTVAEALPKAWVPRLLPGQETLVFSFYGAPADPAELATLTEVLQRERLANGFDLAPAPHIEAAPTFRFLVQQRWPVVSLPPFYGEFQVAGSRSRLDDAQEGLLATLDQAGVFNALQLGEWGYYFHELSHNESWWRGAFGNDFEAFRHLMKRAELRGFDRHPTSREDAYRQVKSYFDDRLASQRGRTLSVTGHSHYECYAAAWGARMIGIELGENIAFAQSKLAFTRGAARQWKLPFSVQVSTWFHASCTSAGPLHLGSDNVWRGMDAGHSLSFYRRMWLHAWFAGAALVTPESSAAISFEPGEPKYRLTEHARAAKDVFQFMLRHDRGTPFTPLLIVIDEYSGYNGFQGKPWGIMENTPGDLMLRDLLEQQLFPGADFWRTNVPLAALEGHYLRPTPHGEIADVILSNADVTTLGSYPVILLAGDHRFEASFVGALTEAVRGGAQLLLHATHAEALGDRLATLQASGRVEVLETWVNPATERVAAISDERLRTLLAEHLPLTVSGDAVQFQVNRSATGWVVEVVNNAGVTKFPERAAEIDPSAKATVTLSAKFPVDAVREWWNDEDFDPTRPVVLEIPPGQSRFVAFTQSH